MPYKSDAQRRWAHTEAGKKALGGEAAVHEWDEATKGKDLPEKVHKAEMGLNKPKAGANSTSVKIPKAPRLGKPGDKPSVFFKTESCHPKHPSVRKLYEFLSKVQTKRSGRDNL